MLTATKTSPGIGGSRRETCRKHASASQIATGTADVRTDTDNNRAAGTSHREDRKNDMAPSWRSDDAPTMTSDANPLISRARPWARYSPALYRTRRSWAHTGAMPFFIRSIRAAVLIG